MNWILLLGVEIVLIFFFVLMKAINESANDTRYSWRPFVKGFLIAQLLVIGFTLIGIGISL